MESLATLATAAADMTASRGFSESLESRSTPVDRRAMLMRPASEKHLMGSPMQEYIEAESRSESTKERDWRVWLSIEERIEIRKKIASAYRDSGMKDFEQLLAVTSSIEEEFLHLSAPSRLDYFKSGVQYDKRVSEKIEQLKIPFRRSDADTNGLPPMKKNKGLAVTDN